jgi:hypothetical protein
MLRLAHLVALCVVLAGCRLGGAAGTGFVADAEAKELIAKCQVVGSIESYFRIPPDNNYRDVFPKMGLSPELDRVDEPFVVVYAGQVDFIPLGGRPNNPPEMPRDVLCVVLPSGEPIIYADVSREGMQLPAGAHLGPPE